MSTYIMEYKSKYEKYKTKYLELKNSIIINQTAGSNAKPELYLFKAEWCGHCENFKKDWDTLSKDSSLNKKINFITMDSDANKDTINEWQVTGFPTLILKNGKNKAIEYGGNRSIKDIKAFIEKNIN